MVMARRKEPRRLRMAVTKVVGAGDDEDGGGEGQRVLEDEEDQRAGAIAGRLEKPRAAVVTRGSGFGSRVKRGVTSRAAADRPGSRRR
ncbi:unnamed protein product [Linum trigynum]|uniref:Uncharacterized protein n=1 Tax=Linum trigynum TaxID=586398 RepID=A0AAV2FEB2_9ROSI